MAGRGRDEKEKTTVKVAVSSQGTDMSSQVDPRFGRAKCFVVVDTETGEFVAHDNTQNFRALEFRPLGTL